MLVRCLLVLIAVIGIAGCATESARELDVAPWRLPEGPPREVVQILNGHYGDKAFALQVRLSMSEEKMLVAGLDSLGRRAFDILWDETGVRAGKADWVSEDLNAADILKVIVATYWPEDDPMQAYVMDRAKDLEISYQSKRANAWNETVEIRNPRSGYEMTIISYELKQ